jgi:methylmalonyl-CoA/ethylmalonyl-CoA epimerase
MPNITINHVAIVVPNIEDALSFWRDALGLSVGKVQDVPQEAVQVAFMDVGESHIELVQPTSDDSGIAKFLANKGAGIHHLCLEVDDIAGALAVLRDKGVTLINDSPRERDGRKYAFIHPKSTGGVLVELYERL